MQEQVTPLGAAFHFTPQDLRANRQGQVTLPQRRRLWLRFLMTLLEMVMLLGMPVLLAWGLIMGTTWQPLTAAIFDQRALIGYLFGVILMLVYSAANFRAFLLVVDLLRGRVIILDTAAQVWGRYLIFEGYRFVLDEKTSGLVKSGVTYRVCILPYSHTLLSIEFSE